MIRRAVLWLLLLLTAPTWGAETQTQAQPVFVRLAVDPQQDIWVGQQVRLTIDVLARDGWATIAQLPRWDIPGVQVLRVESQGTRLNETIDGVAYAGQRYQWLVFPKRPGVSEIPAVPVEVTVKTFGANESPQTFPLETPGATFEAALPPGAEGVGELISTTGLRASQTWEPEDGIVAVGDGIRRRIVLEADGVPGMAFAPLVQETIDGVSVYPGEPEVADKVNRGTLDYGTRIETLTYVPEGAGTVTLPDIAYAWWDSADGALKEETLEGMTIEVASPAGAGIDPGPSMDKGPDGVRPLYVVVAVVLILLAGLLWGRGPLSRSWRALRDRRREHESAYFNRFRQAAAGTDPRQALRGLMRWLDRLDLPASPALLEGFVRAYGDEDAVAECGRLLAAVTADGGTDWTGGRLGPAMGRARDRYLRHQAAVRGGDTGALPRLNPAHPA